MSNLASALNKNPELAEATFEKWRSSQYGEAYWEAASEYIRRTGVALEPWQVLNNFFQIAGNITDDKQSVILYCVCSDGSTTWYRTYTIPGVVQNNVAATFLGIKDEQGVKVGETYRDINNTDPYNGLDSTRTLDSKEPVKLERNKRYTVDAILSYFSNENGGKDQTSNTDRQVTFGAIPAGSNASIIYGASLSATSNLDASAYSSNYSTDGKRGGSIIASIGI